MQTLFDQAGDPPAPARPAPPGVTCPHCQGTKATTTWQVFADGTRHLRADCQVCRSFIRYLPNQDKPPALRRGGRQANAQAVMADLANAIDRRVNEDDRLNHEVAAVVGDITLAAVEEVSRQHKIGQDTDLVTPHRRTG